MRLSIKAALTGVLALAAVLSALWAIQSIKANTEPAPSISYQWSCAEKDAEFVLREYEGYVGVFNANGRSAPVSVTDIQVVNLREADRAMLGAGIAVADRDELLTLLEDLGS